MTDDLTKQLKEILPQLDVSNNRIEPLSDEEAIEQITQAFIDAGWIHVSASQETQAAIANTMLGNKVMTGQEWYDKFLDSLEIEVKNKKRLPKLSDCEFVFEAAKKASGIE